MLIDIGANLTHSSFSRDLEAVMARAGKAGVDRMIVTGCDEEHSDLAQAMTGQWPGQLFSTAGVHPHQAKTMNDRTLGRLEALCHAGGVVAVGECGLDYNRDFSPRPDQLACFEAQLELAVSLQLPVFLHQRDAHQEFVRLLARYRDELANAVAHCFTGDAEELAAYLDLDLYIGITGWICDERRGSHLCELVPDIPAERLMVETDAPYLLPRDLKPTPKDRRNEPMYLPHIVERIASCRGETPAALALSSTRAAEQFFRLPVVGNEATGA